ncbi:hypothetical protein [Ktedonobacter racemifer]|uniref:GGDEF domain protein n=1 Tax=Ktedonobacter racemifer DSM 44963 TaxID=485913 RepID=D6TQ48_KTERA|nr:hypothetical protein [Ktedonobacter racemifer]EFH85696.1 GGDEF domain protein [Ktedonobacter racemifer DSM 44963]
MKEVQPTSLFCLCHTLGPRSSAANAAGLAGASHQSPLGQPTPATLAGRRPITSSSP